MIGTRSFIPPAKTPNMLLQEVFDHSRDIKRAEAMGFKFERPRIADNPKDFGWVVGGTFFCVCGTLERYQFTVDIMLVHADPDMAVHLLDVGRMLREAGSFSREHLLADGYSAERVDIMLAKAQAWDKANP